MTPLSASDPTLIRVVASVITDDDGRFLLCQRPAHKRHGNLWEFPGGKIEAAEAVEEAARRELLEELDVEVQSVGELQYSTRDSGSAFVIEFYPVAIHGIPRALEHAALAWIRLDELDAVPLAPSDRRFAEFLASSRDAVH